MDYHVHRMCSQDHVMTSCLHHPDSNLCPQKSAVTRPAAPPSRPFLPLPLPSFRNASEEATESRPTKTARLARRRQAPPLRIMR